jgi:DNA modification methylase
LKKKGVLHSSIIAGISTLHTIHGVFIQDAVEFLKTLPDSSVQLIIIDPPYNLDLDNWDTFHNYLEWAKGWLLFGTTKTA